MAAHWLALRAASTLTVASIRLSTVPRERMVALLGEPLPPARPEADRAPVDPARLQPARRIGRMVERVAGILPWHPTCLPQAVATQRLLARRGIPSVLHLGIADAATMDAHAWVTVDGAKVVGRQARPFTPVASFSG